MIDWTKPIRQKNGRRAVFLDSRGYMVACEIDPGSWGLRYYLKNGRCWGSRESTIDLENIPEA